MARFQVLGKGKDSGRKRRKIYTVFDENEARTKAKKDKILVEKIEKLPPEPATDKQIEYARNLGINFSKDISKDEISDLISLNVNNDKTSKLEHREIAKYYRIDVTDYVGKKSLFDIIHYQLSERENRLDLISWFTFRVYRNLVNGATDVEIKSPEHQIIQNIAKYLIDDEKVYKSIKRYEGSNLIFFGEFTSPNGFVVTGGSNRTIAYETISGLLKEKIDFSETKIKTKRKDLYQAENKKGCLSILLIVLLPLFGLSYHLL